LVDKLRHVINDGDIMDFIDVINKRHSVRDFKKDEISEDKLIEIIKLAERAPSWENSQPWNVYIATGKTLDDITEVWIGKNEEKIKGYPDMSTGHRTYFSERGQKNMQDFMDGIADFIDDEGNAYFMDQQHLLFNAPAIVYLTIPKGYMNYSIYDLGGFGLMLMLAATELGIDSIPAYELIKYPDVLREHMDIPEDEDIIMGIALGYEADNKINEFKAPRLDIDEILKIKN